MNESDKLKAYLDLTRYQMDHHKNIQDVEWKGSFGVWTLLAAAIYFQSSQAHVHKIDTWILIPVLCVLTTFHVVWLSKTHQSEEHDKELWCLYRAEARRLLGVNDLVDSEIYKRRTGMDRSIWLLLEAGITGVLCLYLFYVSQ